MARNLKTLVVFTLLALLPLRALAAATIGLCAMSEQQQTAVAHQGCEEHQPAEPVKVACNICIEHCSSAAFVLPAAQSVAGQAVSETTAPLAARVAPAFFPDQLDRPPLA